MKEIFIFLVLLHFSESTFAKDECFKGKCSLEVDGHQYFSMSSLFPKRTFIVKPFQFIVDLDEFDVVHLRIML